MRIYEYLDYRKYLAAWLATQPRRGYGQMRLIAKHLNVHTTLVSQIFGGKKDLTLEQAAALYPFFGLGDQEGDYFVALVEVCRAGSPQLKSLVERRIAHLQERAGEIANRVPQDRVLNETERATFYSNWYYCGVWLLASVEGYNTAEKIASRFNLPLPLIRQVLEFLLSTNLLVAADGRIDPGAQHIHLGDSPFRAGTHRMWRAKAMGRYESLRKDELAFSGPLSLPRANFAAIRPEIVAFIERTLRRATQPTQDNLPPEPDMLACLNIDWFEF